MKTRTLIAFLLSVIAGLQQVKAQEAYAAFDNGTLTFYYDDLRSSHTNTFSLPDADYTPEWYSDGTRQYVTEVIFDVSFKDARPTTTYSWFNMMEQLQSIIDIDNLNTSEVTSMAWMFNGCKSLTSLEVGQFNTAKVKNMTLMFSGCQSLMSLDLSHFNTANVKDMRMMFSNCNSLTSLDVSNFNTSNVTAMNSMFSSCYKLTSLNLSNFNTASVTDMSYMFSLCMDITSINLSNFNTSNVTNMESMFVNCGKLTTIYVGAGWNTAAVTKSAGMFSYCEKLVGGQGTKYDKNHTDKEYARIDGGESNPGYFTASGTEPWKELEAYACYTSENTTLTFYYDNLRSSRPGTKHLVSNSNNMPAWYYDNASKVTEVIFDESFADVRPTCMVGWFHSMNELRSIVGLEYLNISEVTNMSFMFYNCPHMPVLDLSNFDTRKVKNMKSMFECSGGTPSETTTIYVGENWSTEKVEKSTNMFKGCVNLVGGAGTKYDANHIDAAYARLDGGAGYPGYFSSKQVLSANFNVDGIYYKDIGGRAMAEVTYQDEDYFSYSGNVEIPEYVLKPENGWTYRVMAIGERAFYRCPYLQNLILPASIDRIENEAFVDAFLDASNSSITCLAKTPPTISPYAFGSEIQSMTLYVPRDCKAAYEAHNIWKQFGSIVELPYSFERNGIYYKIIDADIVSVSYKDSNYNCYSGEVTIPSTVTYGDVTYTVTKIDNIAFFNCPQLRRVIIPSTVTSIGNRSFKDCPLMADIIIPENVQSIGVYAFDGCTALTDITCLSTTPPTISYDTFTESQYQGANLYVPYGCYNLYWNAPNWEYFRNLFELPPDEDAINEVAEEAKDDAIYDLSGRKVTNPTKGIYIRNGKKFLIR